MNKTFLQTFTSPLGSGISLGIHESQSRIFENQIGRSSNHKVAVQKMKEILENLVLEMRKNSTVWLIMELVL